MITGHQQYITRPLSFCACQAKRAPVAKRAPAAKRGRGSATAEVEEVPILLGILLGLHLQ